jgi:hypothetical protein
MEIRLFMASAAVDLTGPHILGVELRAQWRLNP